MVISVINELKGQRLPIWPNYLHREWSMPKNVAYGHSRQTNMADTSRTDIRSALSNPGGWKSLIIFFVLTLAWLVGFSSRLFAVIRFESIIHEFDPWWEFLVASQVLGCSVIMSALFCRPASAYAGCQWSKFSVRMIMCI